MSEGRNKAIIILLIVVVALGGILLYKIYGPKEEKNINITNYESSSSENTIKNEKDEVVSKKEVKLSNNPITNMIWNIIDIIVILLIVPNLLEKYNVGRVAIILTIYKAVRALLTGFSGGFIAFVLLVLILLLYCTLLLLIMDKFLLGTGPLTFFFGTAITESILYYIVMFIFALIVTRFIM